jgi:hypothetical protein
MNEETSKSGESSSNGHHNPGYRYAEHGDAFPGTAIGVGGTAQSIRFQQEQFHQRRADTKPKTRANRKSPNTRRG